MKESKKINTSIRKSVKSWHGLYTAVAAEAKTAPEVTINSKMLLELCEHLFIAGYLEANRDAGESPEKLYDPYPYSEE